MEVELPDPPSELTAVPVSAFSILVRWTGPADQDVDKYKLYYRQVSGLVIEIYIYIYNVQCTYI